MGNKKINTKQALTTALLREGQNELANLWGVDATTVGRRLNDQAGMKLSEFADALDMLGIQIITPDEDMVTIPRTKLEALKTFAIEGIKAD